MHYKPPLSYHQKVKDADENSVRIFFCFWNNIYFRLLRISLQVLSSIFISILVFSVWSFLLKVKHENIIYANITSPLSSQAFTISRKEYYLCLCMNQCFAFRILFEYKRSLNSFDMDFCVCTLYNLDCFK